MKVQFELQPLPNDNYYPEEAILCSATTLEILQVLKAKVENAWNKGMPCQFHTLILLSVLYHSGVCSEKQPKITDFLREPPHEDHFVFLINTTLVFRNVPDPTKIDMPTMN
jgi:hypothetical protein